jgi:hypothetical protein
MRLEETSVNGSGQAMREALARKHDWESHGQGHWGYGVAIDLLALERRVAALERLSGAGKSAGEDNDSPGEGWRWVEADEALMAGDEYIGSDGGWRKSQLLGRPCEDEHAYRRRIDAKSNHDAAPAARAQLPEADHAACRSRESDAGTGNQTAPPCVETDRDSSRKCVPPAAATQRVGSDEWRPLDAGAPTRDHAAGGRGRDTQEPVAWAVMLAGGERIYDVYAIEEDAKAIDEAVTGNHGIVPLYRQPALTAEECEAIELAAYDYLYHQDPGGRAQWIRQQLLGLLARTK